MANDWDASVTKISEVPLRIGLSCDDPPSLRDVRSCRGQGIDQITMGAVASVRFSRRRVSVHTQRGNARTCRRKMPVVSAALRKEGQQNTCPADVPLY
jgi:hypothetical protein